MTARRPVSLRVHLVAGFVVVALASVLLTEQRTRGAADAQLAEAVSFVAASAPQAPAQAGAPARVDAEAASRQRDLVRHLDDRLGREGLVTGVVAVAIALALALILAKFVARPLNVLDMLVRRLVTGDPEPELHAARGTREMRDLHGSLAQLSAELRTRQEARRAAVAQASHESRNAVAGILGRIEAIRDGVLVDRAGALELIEEDARRLLRQVDDLDRVAGERAEPVVERSAVDLDSVIRASVRRHAAVARAKRLEITCWSDGTAVVDGDREVLSRVVDNLLSNALRYTDPGGQVSFRVWPRADRVRLEVADSGIGMTAQEVARIFDAFWRGVDACRRVPEGSGVGLAVVRESVDALAGTIKVTSRAGVGSCFRIDLPAAAASAIAVRPLALRVA